MKEAVLAAVAVVVIALVGVGSWVAFGADDEASVRGTCGSSSYVLGGEDDDDGLEVTFELQSAAPGEVWDVTVLQGEIPILDGQRTTDEDAELDIDTPADDAAGTGFAVEAVNTAGGETCTAQLS